MGNKKKRCPSSELGAAGASVDCRDFISLHDIHHLLRHVKPCVYDKQHCFLFFFSLNLHRVIGILVFPCVFSDFLGKYFF